MCLALSDSGRSFGKLQLVGNGWELRLQTSCRGPVERWGPWSHVGPTPASFQVGIRSSQAGLCVSRGHWGWPLLPQRPPGLLL